MVHHVRDAVEDKDGEIVDEGVSDKRLLIEESEFAAVLAAAKRQQNTLSAMMRKAWDRGGLQTLAKNSPTRATDAHISVVAHITPEELKRSLTVIEQSNGFANRFLFAYSQRTKLLPFGGRVPRADLAYLGGKVQQALDLAHQPGELGFARDAEKVWIKLYPELTTTGPGLLGSICARGAAHVLRLASIYCVLDSMREIQMVHLYAASALWDYCKASAAMIFGDATGDPDCDEIIGALRAQPAGLTRTEIVDLFSRHLDRARIEAALAKLLSLEIARFENEPTKGRPIQRWFAVNK